MINSYSKFAGMCYLFLFAFINTDACNTVYIPNTPEKSFKPECIFALALFIVSNIPSLYGKERKGTYIVFSGVCRL